MSLLLVHARIQLLELVRDRTAVTSILVLPALVYTLFGIQNVSSSASANYAMSGFSLFAVSSVVFVTFGVGIAQQRVLPWETFLRTLPVRASTRLAARCLVGLGMAAVAVGLIVALATLLTPVILTPQQWAQWAAAVLLGAVSLATLGLALGYWVSPTAAVPIANVLYLVLAYAGGLWGPPTALPAFVRRISPYLPTRRYVDAVTGVIRAEAWAPSEWLWLLGYALVFGAFTVWGYSRDEGMRYG